VLRPKSLSLTPPAPVMALEEAWLILKRTRTSDGSVPYSAGYVPSFHQASQDAQGQAQIDERNSQADALDRVADETARARPWFFGRKKYKDREEYVRDLAGQARQMSGVQQRNIDAGRERGHPYSREKMRQGGWAAGTNLSSVPSSYNPLLALEGRRTTAERADFSEGGDKGMGIEGFEPYKYPRGYSGSYPFPGGPPSGAPDDGAGITRDRGEYTVPEGWPRMPKGPSGGGIEDPVSPDGKYYYDYDTQQWVLNQ